MGLYIWPFRSTILVLQRVLGRAMGYFCSVRFLYMGMAQRFSQQLDENMTKEQRQAIQAKLKFWGLIASQQNLAPNKWPRESIFYRIICENVEHGLRGISHKDCEEEFNRINRAIMEMDDTRLHRSCVCWKYRDKKHVQRIFIDIPKTTFYNRLAQAEARLAKLL